MGLTSFSSLIPHTLQNHSGRFFLLMTHISDAIIIDHEHQLKLCEHFFPEKGHQLKMKEGLDLLNFLGEV